MLRYFGDFLLKSAIFPDISHGQRGSNESQTHYSSPTPPHLGPRGFEPQTKLTIWAN